MFPLICRWNRHTSHPGRPSTFGPWRSTRRVCARASGDRSEQEHVSGRQERPQTWRTQNRQPCPHVPQDERRGLRESRWVYRQRWGWALEVFCLAKSKTKGMINIFAEFFFCYDKCPLILCWSCTMCFLYISGCVGNHRSIEILRYTYLPWMPVVY